MADLRFQRIDATTIGLHWYLQPEDEVYYMREFTSRKGFSYSETNQRISNLKKKRGAGGYQYKQRAIDACVAEMTAAFSANWLRTGTLVPIPPSKIATDPAYDDRMLKVCQGIAARSGTNADVRELVVQRQSSVAAHETENRPKVEDLIANYAIVEERCAPAPTAIALVDDVLTNGTHFKAMQAVLRARFPNVPIVGMFIARRVFADDLSDWIENLDD